MSTAAPSTPWPSAAEARHRAGERVWPAGREHPGHRLQLRSATSRRAPAPLCAARRRPSSPPSRAARRAASPSPLPRGLGLWGKPTNINNVKSYANVPQIIAKGAEWFASIGTERSPGHGHLCPLRQGEQHRPGRGAHGHHPGRDHLRHRRRHPQRQAVQGRADRGPLGGCLPASASTCRSILTRCAGRRHHGLRRHDRGGRGHLHGRVQQVLPHLRHRRVLRQVRPCRVGGKRMLEILTRITEGQGHPGGPRPHRGARHGHERGSLCALGQLTPSPCAARCAISATSTWPTSATSAAPRAPARPWSGPAASTPARPAWMCPAYLTLVAEGKVRGGTRRPPRAQPLRRDLRPRLPRLLRAEVPPRRDRRAGRRSAR
jgi:hypothetical protein